MWHMTENGRTTIYPLTEIQDKNLAEEIKNSLIRNGLKGDLRIVEIKRKW